MAEYDDSGNELRSYGYQPDSTWGTDPLWLREGGEYYWYQNDHLGTPQKLVDSSGSVIWSATYTAFGKAQIAVETVTNNLRFPGQYYDAETGLHYNYHRDYDPETGRYLQTDPIGFDGGDENLYAYVWNGPVSQSDPTGLVTGVEEAVIACLSYPPCVMAVTGAATAVVGWTACRLSGNCKTPLDDDVPAPPIFYEVEEDGEDTCPVEDGTDAEPKDPNNKRRYPKTTCDTAIKILEQYERLAEKMGKNIGAKRLKKLNALHDSGAIKITDLPATLGKKFPGEFTKYPLKTIKFLCGKD